MELVEITEKGKPPRPVENLTDIIKEVMSSTTELYASSGYIPPWIGYLAFDGNNCVGTCAFKSFPENGRVEIAYFTFPEFERQGIATHMAQKLVEIALELEPQITIVAQTLPDENASTAVLKKLGFRFVAEMEHPEDGKVWEWQLRNSETSKKVSEENINPGRFTN